MDNYNDNLNDSWRELTQLLRKEVVKKNKEIEDLELRVKNLEKFIDSPQMQYEDDYASCSDVCTDLY